MTVADFIAKPEGTALYKLTGKVGKITNTTYGNFDLIDATGKVLVYGLTNNGAIGSNDKKFAELGIKEGDVVTIIGTRAAYNGTAQVGGTAYLVSHRSYTEVTVAEFLAKEKSKDNWYKLTGKVTGLKTGNFGNFHLVDETGSVYVYGLTVAPVAKNDQSFPKLGIKEGDIVTLVGTRDYYKDAKVPEEKDQVGGPAYYISHETPAEGGDDNTGDTPATGTYTHTFAKGDLAVGDVTLSGVKWNLAMTDNGSKYFGWDSNETAKGVQIGKKADPATSIVLKTSAISGTVKSIKVNTSGASNTDAKLNVTVGGKAFGSEVSLTTSATEYAFTGAESGEIVLSWSCTAAAAVYVKSIEIVSE